MQPETYEKGVAQNRAYYFDFSLWPELIGTGAAIVSATVTVTGVGLTVAAPILTSAARLQVRVSGGTAGQVYTLTCAATTSAGDTLVQKGSVSVI
jgi:hypothetical protein